MVTDLQCVDTLLSCDLEGVPLLPYLINTPDEEVGRRVGIMPSHFRTYTAARHTTSSDHVTQCCLVPMPGHTTWSHYQP